MAYVMRDEGRLLDFFDPLLIVVSRVGGRWLRYWSDGLREQMDKYPDVNNPSQNPHYLREFRLAV